jgi:hypothetical protein
MIFSVAYWSSVQVCDATNDQLNNGDGLKNYWLRNRASGVE